MKAQSLLRVAISSLRQRFHSRLHKFFESLVELFDVAATRNNGCFTVFVAQQRVEQMFQADVFMSARFGFLQCEVERRFEFFTDHTKPLPLCISADTHAAARDSQPPRPWFPRSRRDRRRRPRCLSCARES